MIRYAKRITAALLVLMMLCEIPGCLPARAEVLLPASLTALEDEAFANDYKVDGLVELPARMTQLGSDVFSGTQVYAISVPAAVKNVPAQGLSDAGYVWLEGAATTADAGAFSGAAYVFGPSDSAAKARAESDGAEFVSTDNVVQEAGFCFLKTSAGATLLCAVDNTVLSGEVTVPSTLSDGTAVTALSAHAMMRCDGVTLLRLPLGIDEAAGCFSGCPKAVITYYSDDGFCVTSIRANEQTVRPETQVTWIARTNTDGAVEYYFEVLRQESKGLTMIARSDGFRSSLVYEDSNRYAVTLTEPGVYVATVTCRDENGTEVTASAPGVVVLSPDLTLTGVSADVPAAREGDTLSWTVSTTGGNGAVLYSYELSLNGELIDSAQDSASATYTLTGAKPGEYVMLAAVRDDISTPPALRADAVQVYTKEAARPEAPVLINTALSSDAASAPAQTAGSIAISWDGVPYAAQYGVTVALQSGDAWSEIEHTLLNSSRTEYTVSAALFTDLAAETLCRIGVYSLNLEAGDARYYYVRLTPRVIDTSVTLDGSSSVYWYEGYYGAASRSFTLSSELPVTFKKRDGGEWFSYTLQDDVLTVTMKENGTGDSQTDRLIISNGVSSATLYLRHYWYYQAPALVWPSGTTQSAPAALTMDPVELLVEDNGCSVNMYIEQLNGSAWETVWSAELDDTELRFCARDAGLEAGTLYRVRLVGYARDLSETVQKDAMVSYAYLTFTKAAPGVAFQSGSTSHSITMTGTSGYSVDMCITGGTPVITSDASWLSAAMDEDKLGVLIVSAPENTTAASRTGHITISCGSASAVLTVQQESNLPVLLQPEALSTSESSPTKVYLQSTVGWNTFRAVCDTMTLEALQDGGYVEISSDSDEDLCIVEPDTADLATGVTHRLSITRGSTTLMYYMTFASASSYYITVDGDTTQWREIAAEGGTASVTLKSKGSWTAASSDSWLTLSATSGSSNTSGKTITLTATANSTGATRFGTVTFKRGSYQQATVIVKQPSVPQSLSIGWDLMSTDGVTGGDNSGEYLYLDTAGEWTATVSDSWLGFNSACTTKTKSGVGIDEFRVYTAELPSGSAPRTGTITVTAGSITRTIQLTQLPLVAAEIISPDFSSDYDAPTIFEHDDLTITWKGDAYAASYQVKTLLENADGDAYTSYHSVMADGSSNYSVTLKKDWMLPDTGYVCRFTLYGTDTAGNTTSQLRYFQVVSGDGVFVDGRASQGMYNMTDLGDYETFAITSTGAWTAYSSHDWITLDKKTGADGDALTVTLGRNYGDYRSGTVTVSCGDNSAVIKVTQSACIPDKAQLKDTALSTDMGNPAVISADTTSLTVYWDEEDQATGYNLRLYQINSTNLRQYYHVVGRDDVLIAEALKLDPDDETCTLSGLSLTPGALYMLDFNRTISDRRTGKTHYYFMAATDGTPYVLVDGELKWTDEYESGEDHLAYLIDSNGTWRAESDADWIMVGDEGYTSDELLEDDCIPSDYATYTSMDDHLVVSTLSNTTGKTRTGHVTVSIPGGEEAVITVVQLRSCTAAVLLSPALTDDRDNPVTLPYKDVNLRWKASSDGYGRYTVTLKERLPDEYRYTTIYTESTSGTSHTIPVDELTQNADYILYLETWVDSTYTVCETYRFHLGFENALSVTADVSWTDTSVSVTANAAGGSGSGYEYSFALRCNGAIENTTMWHDSQNSFGFTFSGAGVYQLEVYVTDSLGQGQTFIVSEYTVGADASPEYLALSMNTWQVGADGGEISLNISASGDWTASSSASWLSVATDDEQPAYAGVIAKTNATGAARVGTVTFTCGGATATLAVTQSAPAASDDGSSITLDRSSWAITTDGASSITLKVEASGPWAATAMPSWITLSSASGEENSRISVYAAPNSGDSRTGTLEISCGSASAVLTIQQLGADTLPMVTAFTMSKTTVETGAPVTFEVEAVNADAVVLVVDGTRYDTYVLSGGSGAFERSFTSDGEREVQLLPLRGNLEGMLSDVRTLTVTSYGKLASPVLNESLPVIIGQGTTVTWQPVPNAEGYVLYLRYGDRQIARIDLDGSAASCDLGAELLTAEGSYTCLLMATAAGYMQSESGIFIDVVTPKVTFNIAAPTAKSVYIPKDTVDIMVDNPSGYNIAVKVTDSKGVVTYLPADNGTISDTYIKGKLLYSPVNTGEVTIQAMAWPTSVRTADSNAWYDARRAVTFTVNGPLVTNISIGGSGTATQLLTNVTTLKATANNAVETVHVELDGVPLTVTKNGEAVSGEFGYDSEVNYVRTFTCQLPAATEGFHQYTVVGTDGEGRTNKRTYGFYVVTPAEEVTKYPAKGGVLLRKLPTTPAASATVLPMSQQLIVRGTYQDAVLGKLYYVRGSGVTVGYVLASETGDEQTIDTSKLYLWLMLMASQPVSYLGGDSIKLDWSCSMDLPASAVFRIHKRAAGTQTWSLVMSTTGEGTAMAPVYLGKGNWEIAVDVYWKNTSYAMKTYNRTVRILGDVTEYVAYIQSLDPDEYAYSYQELMDDIDMTVQSILTIHNAWDRQEMDEFVESGVFQFYRDVFGDGIPMDDDAMAQFSMTMAIMESLAPEVEDVPAKESYDLLNDFFDFFDKTVVNLDTIRYTLKMHFGTGNVKFDKIVDWLQKGNLKEIEAFNGVLDTTENITKITDAVVQFVRYALIPDEELNRVAQGLLLCKGNANLQAVGNMLLELRSTSNVAAFCLSINGLEVAKILKSKIGDALVDGLGKLTVVGALAIKTAFAINEGLLNTNAHMSAAVRVTQCFDATDAYMSTFLAAYEDFKKNPLKNYGAFVESARTFLMLMDLEFNAFADWRAATNDAGWSKFANGLSGKSDEIKQSIENTRNTMEIWEKFLNTKLMRIHEECLYKFGVTYVPLKTD